MVELRFIERDGRRILQTGMTGGIWTDVPLVVEPAPVPSLAEQCADIFTNERRIHAGTICSRSRNVLPQLRALLAANPEPDADGFLPWPGANPFNHSLVEARRRDGQRMTNCPDTMFWHHDGGDDDIVAFKPVGK